MIAETPVKDDRALPESVWWLALGLAALLVWAILGYLLAMAM